MPTPRIRLREAVHRDRHRVELHFSDTSHGLVDLSDLLADPPFTALRDEAAFKAFGLAGGTLVWPAHDLGLAVEFLYARANGLPEPATRDDAQANVARVAERSRGIVR